MTDNEPHPDRILVIDDNRGIHGDFRKILGVDRRDNAALAEQEAALFGKEARARRQPRVEVQSAYQGQEGLIRVRQALQEGKPYAMAFVDVRMPPGWDGIETALKIWEVAPDLQVVICTAYADYSWDEMSERLGRSDRWVILKKPFDPVEVLQLVNALTEKVRLLHQARAKQEELERRVQERTADLAVANETLRKSENLRSIGTLARGMAQEINNPIMGVLNYAQLIKDMVADNASLVEFADEMIVEIRRVANMTHSLLSFAQQQDAQPFIPTTVADVVAAVLPLAAESARERGIVLSSDVPLDLPAVSGHPGQLGQLVIALLTNALEAFDNMKLAAGSLGGGDQAIRLTAQPIEKAGQLWLRLSVEDNGPGISHEIQERSFEPFFTTKDRTKHAGLGLWISRSIAQEHGGELTCDSEVGHGTRFHVDISVVSGCEPVLEGEKDCHEQDSDR